MQQVYTQLNKVSLCTSHTRLLKLVDSLGKDFDKPVTTWKKNIEQIMEKSSNIEVYPCIQGDMQQC